MRTLVFFFSSFDYNKLTYIIGKESNAWLYKKILQIKSPSSSVGFRPQDVENIKCSQS